MFIDVSCMAITVLLQKTRAFYGPQFNFGRPFVDEESDFYMANFQFLRIFAQIDDFSIISQGYNF